MAAAAALKISNGTGAAHDLTGQKTRAQSRLQAQAPAPVDMARVRQVEEEAAALVQEARRRNPLACEKPVANVIQDHSEVYYRYLMRRRHREPKRSP